MCCLDIKGRHQIGVEWRIQTRQSGHRYHIVAIYNVSAADRIKIRRILYSPPPDTVESLPQRCNRLPMPSATNCDRSMRVIRIRKCISMISALINIIRVTKSRTTVQCNLEVAALGLCILSACEISEFVVCVAYWNAVQPCIDVPEAIINHTFPAVDQNIIQCERIVSSFPCRYRADIHRIEVGIQHRLQQTGTHLNAVLHRVCDIDREIRNAIMPAAETTKAVNVVPVCITGDNEDI